jgi:hypothetical protein
MVMNKIYIVKYGEKDFLSFFLIIVLQLNLMCGHLMNMLLSFLKEWELV